MNLTPKHQRLIDLFRQMADLTLPECKACPVPLSCCSPEYCHLTVEHARIHWQTELTPTGSHATLPLMGLDGCVAAPHLRPLCTLHTCSVNAIGCKKGDVAWTLKYFELREEIEMLGFELFPIADEEIEHAHS